MPLEFSNEVLGVQLVSLTVAKNHLHITDSDHDADITQKLEAAQDLILAKLGPAADTTWTETTVPKPIYHTILLALDAFDQNRGGDEANDKLQKALASIDLLLAKYRDPTLA
jgi:hypothetical protein